MSVLFIECGLFLREFPEWNVKCCANCHSNQNRIYVVPYGEDYPNDRNGDYFLCVEAQVCCALYDKVRALPRSFWVNKSVEAGVRRDDGKGYRYTDSTWKDTEKPVGQAKPTRKGRGPAPEDPDEARRAGGIKGFLSRR